MLSDDLQIRQVTRISYRCRYLVSLGKVIRLVTAIDELKIK